MHSLTAYPVTTFGTPEQQAALLPGMLSGDQLGAYCLSEPLAGSDVGSMTTRAVGEGGGDGEPTAYRLRGRKAWISHAGHADYYTTFARTSDDGGRGLSCFVVPADAPGLSFGTPERKMGLHCDTVREVMYDDVPVDAVAPDRRRGPGHGHRPVRAGCRPARDRRCRNGSRTVGPRPRGVVREGAPAVRPRRSRRNQGLAFLIADMEAAVTSARATYLHAARLKDAGAGFSKEAAVAKLIATDAAMRVTTDAVQVLGGAGYTQDFPAERFMREAKVTQIFEGTNQIQRLVISRHVLR